MISIKELINQANTHFQNGLFPEAELLFRNILLENPNDHTASLGVALAALQQNKLTDAIQFMRHSAEIAPEIALYRRNLGVLLRRVKQLK